MRYYICVKCDPSQKQTLRLLARKQTIPTNVRRLSAKLAPSFAGRKFGMVNATVTHGR
jgi:hypothetical protein